MSGVVTVIVILLLVWLFIKASRTIQIIIVSSLIFILIVGYLVQEKREPSGFDRNWRVTVYCDYSEIAGLRSPTHKGQSLHFAAHVPVAGYKLHYDNGETATQAFDPNPPVGVTVTDGVAYPWIAEIQGLPCVVH